MIDLEACQKILGYQYQNLDLLDLALTHRSYLNENKNINQSNERLEFLGDAVLELVTSNFLFLKFPDMPEGKLTNLRSKIVQTKTLAAISLRIKVNKFLKLSHGEAEAGGNQNVSLLADLMEAIIGSIYLDGGFEKAQQFITKHILNDYQKIIAEVEVEDWKSKLQEWVQANNGNAPTYEVVNEEGPDHQRIFTVEVSFFDKPQAQGKGKSKQKAQQDAAKNALNNIRP